VPVDEALARFAPRGQARGVVPTALRVDVLMATDLASEGLNLQDADVVVHYDLPWNPVRLAQRVGRTVRLGGTHEHVDVWWFAPPEPIDRTLGTLDRISRKAAVQLSLPVPTTSLVGRAHVVSDMLERREGTIHEIAGPVHGHAVVRGPPSTCAVIRWEGLRGPLREVLSLSNGAGLDALAGAAVLPPCDGSIPPATLSALRSAVQLRARQSCLVTLSPATRDLARRVLALARVAGARRDRRLLSRLDAALARLRDGVVVGAERELAGQLGQPTAEGLAAWLARHPARDPGLHAPTLETVLACIT
jgi:hypothetical protein